MFRHRWEAGIFSSLKTSSTPGSPCSSCWTICRRASPASLKVCVLLEKPARTKCKVTIDYKGFVIEDRFVVGYGLDYAEKYRNLPFVGDAAE